MKKVFFILSLLGLGLTSSAQTKLDCFFVIWKVDAKTNTTTAWRYISNAPMPFLINSLAYKSSPKCVSLQTTYTNDRAWQWEISHDKGLTWNFLSYCARPYVLECDADTNCTWQLDTNFVYYRDSIAILHPNTNMGFRRSLVP